jgi:HK97 family phage prohead protease
MAEKISSVEKRAFLCEVRTKEDEEKGNILEGVPIVFNQRTDLGWFDEIIEPEALDKADMKDVRFLVNHDTNSIPFARSRNNNKNSTMQLNTEKDGLHIRVALDIENNPRAQELYSAVNRGDMDQMSFMFRVDGEKWENLDSDHPTRHITSISKIYEVSAVTFPAYEGTSINARSTDDVRASLDSAREALESARKLEEARSNLLTKLKEIRS